MEIVARHHNEQRLIARNVVAELHPLWEILDFHDLKGSTAPWLKAVRPVIEKGYLTSQYVAAAFVNDYRRTVLPAADPLGVELPNPFGPLGLTVEADRETQLRIMVSMKVTGPVWLARNSSPGVDESQTAELMSNGFRKSTGAATRLVLNGGRGMVRMLIGSDPFARGVVGIADEGACDSCRFLASTPLLKDTHTPKQMDAVAVGHDFCTCSAAPVY